MSLPRCLHIAWLGAYLYEANLLDKKGLDYPGKGFYQLTRFRCDGLLSVGKKRPEISKGSGAPFLPFAMIIAKSFQYILVFATGSGLGKLGAEAPILLLLRSSID